MHVCLPVPRSEGPKAFYGVEKDIADFLAARADRGEVERFMRPQVPDAPHRNDAWRSLWTLLDSTVSTLQKLLLVPIVTEHARAMLLLSGASEVTCAALP